MSLCEQLNIEIKTLFRECDLFKEMDYYQLLEIPVDVNHTKDNYLRKLQVNYANFRPIKPFSTNVLLT